MRADIIDYQNTIFRSERVMCELRRNATAIPSLGATATALPAGEALPAICDRLASTVIIMGGWRVRSMRT